MSCTAAERVRLTSRRASRRAGNHRFGQLAAATDSAHQRHPAARCWRRSSSAIVITSSLITRYDWVALERSISDIVGVLTPTQSNLVYLVYGIAILALPFAILVGLVAGRQWKLLGAYARGRRDRRARTVGHGPTASRRRNGTWTWPTSPRPSSRSSSTTRAGSRCSPPCSRCRARGCLRGGGAGGGRCCWRSCRSTWSSAPWCRPAHCSAWRWAGSSARWWCGWSARRRWRCRSKAPCAQWPTRLPSRAPDGHPARRPGSLLLAAACPPTAETEIELYGPNQRSGGALAQVWRRLTLRAAETAPLSRVDAPRRRAPRADGDRDRRSRARQHLSRSPSRRCDRGWTLYAHTPPRHTARRSHRDDAWCRGSGDRCETLHDQQISHGDLRAKKITVDGDAVLFGGFDHAEYGATDAQLQSDIAQLLVTTSALYDVAGRGSRGDRGLRQGRGLDRRPGGSRKPLCPSVSGTSIPDSRGVIGTARDEVKLQTGADEIQTETVTRFNRNQIIQMVLLVALVYVALPFISTVPTFLSELRTANWWWGLLGLAVSALKYVGAAAALWACADGLVSFRNLTLMQVANTFAATTTPAGVGGLALSARFLQKGGLGALRAATAVALQQSVQVVTHIAAADPVQRVRGSVGRPLALRAVGDDRVSGRRCDPGRGRGVRHRAEAAQVADCDRRPAHQEVLRDLRELATRAEAACDHRPRLRRNDSRRRAGAVGVHQAFGGDTSFVTVTVVTMIGGTLASAAPTPGGVGAVEAALIGGLAAFGVPAGIAVPSVLLYRVLTCWLPVFVGWFLMRWMTDKEMI